MTDPVLKVKNNSTQPVELPHPDGTTVEVGAGKSEDVKRPVLASDGFLAEFRRGSLTFEEVDSTKADVVALGQLVARRLLAGMASEIVGAANRMQATKATLAGQRDAYNASHQSAKKVIEDSKNLEAGAQRLLEALVALMAPAEIKVHEAAEQALKNFDKAFIGAGAPDEAKLAAYLAKRAELVAAADAAARARDAAAIKLAGGNAPEFAQIAKARETMGSITAAQIGDEVKWP